jgi:hypothetical protein
LEISLCVSAIKWLPCYRIIPSRYPPINIYERVSSNEDFEILVELESVTNPRIRQERGEINLVDKEDRIYGAGAGYVMAAFTHFCPEHRSRFSDGTYGIYYAAQMLKTAISETKYHREKFMKDTNEAKTILEMKVIEADLEGELHDIRHMKDKMPEVYDSESYIYSQIFGSNLKKEKSWGIIYESLRDEKGECVAILRPPVLQNIRSNKHLCYEWDGEKINSVYEKVVYF